MLLAACEGNNKNNTAGSKNNVAKEENEISFTQIAKEIKIPMDSLTPESPELTCNIKLQFASPTAEKEFQNNINDAIIYRIFGYENLTPQAAIDSFITQLRLEYNSLRPEYHNEKAMNHEAAWFNYNYDITGNVERGYNNIINYTLFSISYTGGAHGSEIHTLMNFDPSDGKEIRLHDIFKEESEEALTERLTKKLAQATGARSIEELKEQGYLMFNDMYPTENFLLGKDSIIFFYNNYDIAPYAMGSTRLAFSYNELHDLIKTDKQ